MNKLNVIRKKFMKSIEIKFWMYLALVKFKEKFKWTTNSIDKLLTVYREIIL